MKQYEIVVVKDELNIIYHGSLYKKNSNRIWLVCGFGTNWEYTQKIEMHKIEEYYIAKVKILDFKSFNFCFCNEKDEWDNNENNDYSYNLEENVVYNIDQTLDSPVQFIYPDQTNIAFINTKDNKSEFVENITNVR